MTFVRICFRCSGFPTTLLCRSPESSSSSRMPRSSARGERIVMQSSSASWRSKGSSTAASRPLSSLLTCSTSFTRDRRCSVDTRIFFRHARCRSGSSWLLSRMASIPRIPLIGVRRSWDMWERNSLLVEFACRTRSRSSMMDCSCFLRVTIVSVMS